MKAVAGFTVREDERLDDLQCGGLFVLQKIDSFRFGMDSVLLAAFAAGKAARRIFDIGTGSGVIPLLMSARMPGASFDAVEIQPSIADMARRSFGMNGLGGRVRVMCADARTLPGLSEDIRAGAYDLVTCNPPYERPGAAMESLDPSEGTARMALTLSTDDVAAAASRLLRTGGRLCMVSRAGDFLSVCDAMRARSIEPKRVRFVYGRTDKSAYLFLIEGIRNARPGLVVMPPLTAHNADGSETEALRAEYRCNCVVG